MKKKLTTEEDYRQRVDWVCMYIREHLDKEIDMRRLAVLSAFLGRFIFTALCALI